MHTQPLCLHTQAYAQDIDRQDTGKTQAHKHVHIRRTCHVCNSYAYSHFSPTRTHSRHVDPSLDELPPAEAAEEIKHHYYNVLLYTAENITDTLEFVDLRDDDQAVKASVSSVDDGPYTSLSLPFYFQFYGHRHNKLHINPNGFMSANILDCSGIGGAYGFCLWSGTWHYLRYMAPLMTDLNPSGENSAEVHYRIHDNQKHVTVQWSEVPLYEEQLQASSPRYTFQAEVNSQGRIIFRYNTMPVSPSDQTIDVLGVFRSYPVVIGLEDTIVLDDSPLKLERYRPINIDPHYVFGGVNNTIGPTTDASHLVKAVVFQPRPTCLNQDSCGECVAFTDQQRDEPDSLQCGWCKENRLCTDGLGRENSITHELCKQFSTLTTVNDDGQCAAAEKWSDENLDQNSAVTAAAYLVLILFFAGVGFCIAYVCMYVRGRHRNSQEAADGNGGPAAGSLNANADANANANSYASGDPGFGAVVFSAAAEGEKRGGRGNNERWQQMDSPSQSIRRMEDVEMSVIPADMETVDISHNDHLAFDGADSGDHTDADADLDAQYNANDIDIDVDFERDLAAHQTAAFNTEPVADGRLDDHEDNDTYF